MAFFYVKSLYLKVFDKPALMALKALRALMPLMPAYCKLLNN